jgi:hypothetical protein
MPDQLDVFEQARRELGISISDLWMHYFALGGMSTALELEAILYSALVAEPHDREILAVAINERFAEIGGDHPMPYSDDDQMA